MEKERGLRVSGHNITNIRYTDDTVLLAESEEDLWRLLDVVVVESERKGLSLNSKMTKRLVISKTEGRRVTWMSSVKGWLQERGMKRQEVELIERARNRKLWHDMITDVQGYGT